MGEKKIPLEELYTPEDLHRGDERVLAAIMAHHGPILARQVASFFTGGEKVISAEDIVQEAMIKMWVNRAKIPNFAQLSGYLKTVAFTTAVDYHRKDKRKSSLPVEEFISYKTDGESLQKRIEARFALEDVFKFAEENLPPRRRSVFLRYFRDNISDADIAAQDGTVMTNIRSARSFAQKDIRNKYDPE